MNLIELSYYLQNESAAQEYLQQKGILKTFTNCPYCNSDKVGNIRRDRMKCYNCKKEWHRRKGSFLEGRHISYAKFLGYLKLFTDDFGLYEISKELSIEYKTCKQLFGKLYQILYENYNFNQQQLSQAILYSEDNKLRIRFLKEDTGFIEVKSYLSLSFKRYKEVGGIYSFLLDSKWKGNKHYSYNDVDRFLSFAKMKLISYRGINTKDLCFYLVDLLERFNQKNSINFYLFIVKKLSFRWVAETTRS